jgi:3-oxoadipate enol-lactonase
MHLTIRGEDINVRRSGVGSPLVLVHSLGTSSALFDEQFSHWSNRDVIAFDARGHGESSARGAVTLTQMAKDIAAGLDQLGVTLADFVGISMGGIICANLYHDRPDLMSRLAIANSFATLGAAGPERARQLTDRITSMPMSEYANIYVTETLLPGTPAEIRERVYRLISGVKRHDYLQTVNSIFTADVSEYMAAMAIPVHVIGSRHDNRTPISLAEKIVAMIPGAALDVLENAGHLSNLDDPRAFNNSVDGFFSRSAALDRSPRRMKR